jgi:hypothetical protein
MQFEYPATLPANYAGDLVSDPSKSRIARGLNGADSAQTWVITTSGASNDATETVNYSLAEGDGRTTTGTFSYTCDGSATQAELAAGLAAAWNADSLLASLGYAEVTDTTNCTITMYSETTSITLTESSSNFSVASTGGPSAALIPYGRLVIRVGQVDREINATNFSALTRTYTPAAVNDATYTASVTIPGVGTYGPVVTLADGSANAEEICTALAALLNALLPANTVVAANVGTTTAGTLVLTAEVDGLYFEANVGSNNASATWTAATNDEPTIMDVYGVALRAKSHVTAYSSGVAGYANGDDVEILRSGSVCLETDSEVGTGDDTIYYHVSGDSLGKFSNTRAATNIPVPSGLLRLDESLSSSLGIFRVEV